MKKIAVLALALALLFSAGCGNYVSRYKAVGFVHSNEPDHAFMSFYSFEGRMVFALKSKGEGELKYTASLESGAATVYYDAYGDKTALCSVKSGDKLDSHGGYVEKGTVWVIVETDGKCMNGSFDFSLEQ